MDLDIIQSTKEGEITQFLCDVRDFFKASLQTSEYENTSNLFYITASDTTESLLHRCELLLNRLGSKLSDSNADQLHSDINKSSSSLLSMVNASSYDLVLQPDDNISYLDMTAGKNMKKSHVKVSNIMTSSIDSDKTFRCSTVVNRQNKSFLHRLHDSLVAAPAYQEHVQENEDDDSVRVREEDYVDEDEDDEPQIYDICQVTTQGSDGEEDEVVKHLDISQKTITTDAHFSLPHIECPYMDLPAGHLAIQKSTKYGQLQRIEKRFLINFFDQSKKCYCGIINDWLLSYEEVTSNKPSLTLYLKMPGVEIEHFGEGKRRDVCFQISTADPNKKFIFQAVDMKNAKEWIHAIETSIRSDSNGGVMRSSRKLPTPPMAKKLTFFTTFQKVPENKSLEMSNSQSNQSTSSDCIYEEPSPVYKSQDTTKIKEDIPPNIPQKQYSPSTLTDRYEYDVPKFPPQPLTPRSSITAVTASVAENLINPYDRPKEDERTKNTSTPLKIEEKTEFQTKFKDIHNELSSQLTNGPNSVKKPLKKSHTNSSAQNDAEHFIIKSEPTTPSSSEQKKQKKSSSPQSSPQRSSDKTSSTRNWFLMRLNKTTSSTRVASSDTPAALNASTPSKSKASEKENLLTSSDNCDSFDSYDSSSNMGSNPASPILKSTTSTVSSSTNSKSKVNMIIKQMEANGHLTSMFSNNFCDNSYEPITISSPTTSFMKKV